MNTASARTKRSLEVLPVLAALVCHAIALDRWLLALPVGLALAAVVVFDVSATATIRRFSIASGVGLLAGLAMLAVSVPLSGPLSPAVLCALTGMLIGFAAFGVLAKNLTGPWISAWILVALSGHVEMSVTLSVSLVAFLAASLVGAVSTAGLWRGSPRVVLHLGLFVGLVALATAGIATGSRRFDGALLQTLDSLFTENGASAAAGIGRDITIGTRSSITLSQRPLLDLSTKPGALRTHVMDRFDGRRWSASSELRSTSHTLAEVPIRTDSERLLEMVLLNDLGDDLPSPAGIWEVHGATPQVAGGWVLRGEAESPRLGMVGDGQERLPPEDESGAMYLAVPEDLRAKLGPLTEELIGKAPTPLEKAWQIEQFFQANFEYSLDTNLAGSEHPLVVLITERRPAYCIYYASAMAVMLRTQGIPTRIVSGFTPTEINPLTGRVTIRQRDAHAWVEAWLPEQQRFVAFDPTPAQSREQVIGQAERPGLLSASVGAVWSNLRRAWLACLYDPAGALARLFRSPITWALLAASLVFYLRQRQTRRTATARISRIESFDPTLRQVYRRYLRSLQQAGVTLRPWETDDELIARLADTGGLRLVTTATEFIARYRLARFRGEAADEHLNELAKLGHNQAKTD
jgi:hypothetical protein